MSVSSDQCIVHVVCCIWVLPWVLPYRVKGGRMSSSQLNKLTKNTTQNVTNWWVTVHKKYPTSTCTPSYCGHYADNHISFWHWDCIGVNLCNCAHMGCSSGKWITGFEQLIDTIGLQTHIFWFITCSTVKCTFVKTNHEKALKLSDHKLGYDCDTILFFLYPLWLVQ